MTAHPLAPTPFQRRVYAAVRHIPKGQTRSYAWVARQIGNPKAVRAVGQALKCNRDPQRVPCHRVIHSDGSLGGYAWGVRRKRRLLAKERLKS
ncbi:MAG: MGMT family protein [Candidatus Omnitrophica bacterium]|nr:MGMT family protein [Candidatus Omnitrophota bacterium]